jgi:hypothetical protein
MVLIALEGVPEERIEVAPRSVEQLIMLACRLHDDEDVENRILTVGAISVVERSRPH